jgi:hypothetical protein
MSMIDYFNNCNDEEVLNQLEIAKETMRVLRKKMENLDTVIFILNYYLRTGVALEPEACGLDLNDIDEDEE